MALGGASEAATVRGGTDGVVVVGGGMAMMLACSPRSLVPNVCRKQINDDDV